MKAHKTHYQNIRLHNNGGICFPECYARGAGPLDLDKSALPTSGDLEKVDCKKCLRSFVKNESWALTGKNRKILQAKGILPAMKVETTGG